MLNLRHTNLLSILLAKFSEEIKLPLNSVNYVLIYRAHWC